MNLSFCRKILTLTLSLAISLSTLNFSASATEPSVPNESVEVRNCVKLKTGKARLIDSNVKKCKKSEKLVYLKFPAGFIAVPGQQGQKGSGIISGKGIPDIKLGAAGDFYLDIETYKLYGPKSEKDNWGIGNSLVGPQGSSGGGGRGPAGETGPTGPQGPAGANGTNGITTLGYSGSFIDTTPDTSIDTLTPLAIPIRTSLWNNKGVTITGATGSDNDAIVIANAGLYNIQFSTQLLNSANSRRTINIWLAQKAPGGSWVKVDNSSTDMILGKDTTDERHVAAWNFFVDAQAGHMYRIMILADNTGVMIHSGTSLLPQGGVSQPPAGTIPLIPGTILTVNQVG